MKVVSLFNHKGGVSKTTTAFNLGWMLARKGQKSSAGRLRSQCNLTGMVLGLENLETADSVQGVTKDGKPLNIKEGLAPAFKSQPNLIQAVQCIPVPKNKNLFLMPGHIGMAEYEVTLGIAQELSGSLVTLRNLPGSLRFLIEKTAEKYAIDIVMIDMSPSLGAVNQNLLSTSDYFIVPMHPDYFSMMAISSLSTVFPKWRAWAKSAELNPALKQAEYPFPSSNPKFLGYVIQKYRPRGGAPSKAFQKWVNQLEEGVTNVLIPALKSCGMMMPAETYEKSGYDPQQPLLQMPDFNSLIASSQEHQIPIFELTPAHLEQQGRVLATTQASQKVFKELFEEAADRVLQVIDASSP